MSEIGKICLVSGDYSKIAPKDLNEIFSKEKNIVMFGGTFDPITNAHLNLALKVLNDSFLNIDKLLFVPVGDKYKKKGKSSSNIRVEILQKNLKQYNKISIDLTEVNSDKKLYSFETLEILHKKYSANMYFLMGSDKLKEFSKWFKANEFIEKHRLIVACRENDDLNNLIQSNELLKKHQDKIFRIDIENNNISSTIVRNKIKNNNFENILYYISQETFDYIRNKNLYK